jgi:hypothetical protein
VPNHLAEGRKGLGRDRVHHSGIAAGSADEVRTALAGELDITDDVDIAGAGAGVSVIVAQHADRVLHVLPGASAAIERLTITRGGEWTSLGIYTFSGPSSVTIFATDTIGSTNADAIRWRCRR